MLFRSRWASRFVRGEPLEHLARVTTAVRLTEAQEQRLAAALGRTLGRQVQLQVDVDPAVLGGVLVRVGDEVIDGTTRHHLRAARVALTRH